MSADRRAETGMTGYELPVYPYVTPPELKDGTRRRYPVVIVGGGLTGLAAACDFAERGIETVVLDEDDTIGVRGLASRGIVMAQRSLEIFDRFGIYERFRAKGVTWSVGRVFSGERELYSFNLAPQVATRQPAFINIQQFYTEWYLVDRVQELKRTDLRWKNKVLGVRSLADRAEIDVETPDGRYTLEAEWLIACDGAGSAVRRALGLDPPVETREDRWCISDVRFKAPLPPERWIWIEAPFNENRAVWRHLMADDVWRMDFQMAPDSDPKAVSDPEVTRQRVRAALGPGVEFDLVWVGPWQYRTFLLDDFRHGRVFFCGDAAHLFNPFGGRGGNSGIQDADNLVWKLALHLRGRAGPGLLDSYSRERRAAAGHNIKLTVRAARFMSPQTAAERQFRRAVLDLAADLPFARALINGGRLSDAFVYADSALTTSGGQAAPNPPIRLPDGRDGHLFDLVRFGPKFLGLWFAPADTAGDAAMAALNRDPLLMVAAVGRFVRGLPPIGDAAGALAKAFRAAPGDLVLLRPDQHVAAHLSQADAAGVTAALKRALG